MYVFYYNATRIQVPSLFFSIEFKLHIEYKYAYSSDLSTYMSHVGDSVLFIPTNSCIISTI